MANIFNYAPDEVTMVLAGLLTVDGFIDGTFISIDKDVMPFKSRQMADGSVSRLYMNSQLYTLSLTLHIGSNSSEFLTKLWQLDEITQKGKFPVLVKDHSGSDLFFSATSWIEGLPTLSKSAGIDTRTWTIKCASAIINYGSNNGESGILEDLLNMATSSLPAFEDIFNG
ncbi:hypothetical protein D9M71_317750 [compost metagenome]